MTSDLASFFSPEGVVIIGASTNPRKLSHGILKNMTSYGFKGEVFPVNPGAGEILGLTCYPDISKVPDPVDLAIVVLPAPMTTDVLRACGDRGIKAVIIISGGFREIGKDGLLLEQACLKIAQQYHMRLIGPNCVGIMDLHTGLNTTFIKDVPDKGGIGFLSQSGAVCGGVVDYIANKHIGFSKFASLGNEVDVDETDMIAYFGEHPKVKVIAAYIESIRDGQKFLRIASEISKEKPIVLLKAGRSDAGARAVSSHTGSLAGSYTAYQAAFKQAGVIEVSDLASLFDVAWVLSCQKLPKGNRVAIFTNAGGPAALASDSLADNGFTLANISDKQQKLLAEKLNPSAQVTNPVDMLGGAEPEDFSHCLSTLLNDPGIDVFLPMLVPQSLVDPGKVARAIVDSAKKTDKTLLACMVGENSLVEARQILHENKVPLTIFPDVPGQVLGSMMQYQNWLKNKARDVFHIEGIDQKKVSEILAQHHKKIFGEYDTRPILAAYGFELVPGGFADDSMQAIVIAEEIGFPVALKLVSDQVLHKSDLGGIALNLKSGEELINAIGDMKAKIKGAIPDAVIEGFLIEKMAPKGLEVIIGMRRDPNFGPLMMFGLGGIYVELFKDVGFSVAPLTPKLANDMITRTKAGSLLKGFRGGTVYDLKAVINTIGRLSQLALDFPEISELEINPLLVLPESGGVKVLDARMILTRE